MNHDKTLREKLLQRSEGNLLRELQVADGLIDFCSNDYLGFARSEKLAEQIVSAKVDGVINLVGSGASRLISGNNHLIERIESEVAEFVAAEDALIFNSGYSANLSFFGCVPQRGDVVFYDELIHASIRDGIKLGLARSYSFNHNSIEDLRSKIATISPSGSVFVVVESIYSMDGDSPDLIRFANYCFDNGLHLVVDEAHSFGLIGENGRGMVSDLKLEHKTYARIITFGKALGCHGAVIVGSRDLRSYMINFARPFIYTTALSIHDQKAVHLGLKKLRALNFKQLNLFRLLQVFNDGAGNAGLQAIPSVGAIRSILIPGNSRAKMMEQKLFSRGFWVKAILSPTVPEGKERIRICLHEFNTRSEVEKLIKCICDE
jgi:8-amino-7-oxononanoate synthase